jgi:aryl-alcohol dehydrogenase-like predicted oxidoreductase
MRHVVLGNTGLVTSPVGLGLAALGRPAYITAGRDVDLGNDRSPDAMRRRTHELLDAAFEAGVRYVDAARSYGRAEEFLASWLAARGLPPMALTVASKWGYTYVAGWRTDAEVNEVKDHSVVALRRQLGETRALLGDHLTLYQIHSATLDTGVLADKEVLAELVRLRQGGLTVGLTVSGPRQADAIRMALEVDIDDVNPFQTVQATWNVLEPSAGPALADAHAAGWGVIVKEAVANGRLTGHGRLTSHGRLGDQPALGRVARRHGASPDQVAIAATLSHPWTDVVLSGAVTVGELESNLEATALTLTDGDLADLATLAQPAEGYWQARSRLAWR